MFLPLAAVLLASLTGLAPTTAVKVPLERTTRPGTTPTPSALYEATHVRLIYGTITAIRNKTEIVVRLRTGYAQRVDATEVLRTGRYSAPLFVGKLVAVTGHLEAGGAILATSITRATTLKHTGQDRWLGPTPTPRP
ncbi:MAG TPA: DUF5666 domain-containing protein [Candidatus Acidoferrales bacterium]|nr:DUF5666 domain-containing protein [Candidatus Acidoferrales bacterium]